MSRRPRLTEFRGFEGSISENPEIGLQKSLSKKSHFEFHLQEEISRDRIWEKTSWREDKKWP